MKIFPKYIDQNITVDFMPPKSFFFFFNNYIKNIIQYKAIRNDEFKLSQYKQFI